MSFLCRTTTSFSIYYLLQCVSFSLCVRLCFKCPNTGRLWNPPGPRGDIRSSGSGPLLPSGHDHRSLRRGGHRELEHPAQEENPGQQMGGESCRRTHTHLSSTTQPVRISAGLRHGARLSAVVFFLDGSIGFVLKLNVSRNEGRHQTSGPTVYVCSTQPAAPQD